MQLEEVRQNSGSLTSLPVQSVSQDFPGCYETAAPLYAVAVAAAEQRDAELELQRNAAPPTRGLDDVVADGNNGAAEQQCGHQFTLSTSGEKFKAEITKWEEFHDQIQQHLSAGTSNRGVSPKSACNFSMGQDGRMYYCKAMKDGSHVYLKVVRDYADRVRICKDIHLDTGDVTLHHRRDKMLEVLGQMYYWKGQRRDVCQCIASCEVCSTGLGAKRKAKPPRQRRDIPQSGPPLPPRKKIKVDRPRKNPLPKGRAKAEEEGPLSLNNADTGTLLRNDLSSVGAVLESELVQTPGGLQIIMNHHPHLQPEQGVGGNKSCFTENSRGLRLTTGNGSNSDLPAQFVATTERGGSLEATEVNFQQIFTTIEEECSDQNSPVLQESSLSRPMTSEVREVMEEEASIYELLFKLPSTPSSISPSVMEAVHMAMKESPSDKMLLSEAAESIMQQMLSLGHGYSIVISPTLASAYTIAVFASMLRMDPLSVSSQISSRLSSPPAVLHDSCCSQMSSSDLGPIKTCTALTGSYNWNLGDMTYPMDKDMVRMAVQSNRVAAVFYQPYAYIEKSQHVSLETLSAVCHSRGADVAVIVDASTMPTNHINLRKLVAELKEFFSQGADLVLMPSVDKLHGQSHASVLVGVSSMLSKVWRSIVLLQKQVCLPLLCLPHDLVGTVVAYKALQEQ